MSPSSYIAIYENRDRSGVNHESIGPARSIEAYAKKVLTSGRGNYLLAIVRRKDLETFVRIFETRILLKERV